MVEAQSAAGACQHECELYEHSMLVYMLISDASSRQVFKKIQLTDSQQGCDEHTHADQNVMECHVAVNERTLIDIRFVICKTIDHNTL